MKVKLCEVCGQYQAVHEGVFFGNEIENELLDICPVCYELHRNKVHKATEKGD